MNPQTAFQEHISDIQAFSEGDVHIWDTDLDDPALKGKDIFHEFLSEDERARASRLLPGVYRNRFVIARGCVRAILGLYLDMPPAGIRFEYLRYGKPSLPPALNPKNIYFNLSHSRSLALCAVTVKREIGIDVEYPRRVLRAEKILDRFFSEGERNYYRAQPDDFKERAFMNLWTMKEAYSKALGRGLSSDLRDIDLTPFLTDEFPSGTSVHLETGHGGIWTIHRFRPEDEYIAALALKGGAVVTGHYSTGSALP